MRAWAHAGLMMVAVALAVTGVSHNAHAASVESLLEPGKLSAKHAKYEDACASCHDRADRTRQSELCLSCHKDVATDLREHRGFHGHMPNAGAGQCSACHSEHLGRDADIVRLDRQQFDHAQTDFPLEGAHRTLDCVSCHRGNEAWRAAKPECGACHRADDAHAGQLGADCAACHGTESWGGGRFDHNKTSFELTGAHQSLRCNACHIGGRYKQTPQTCVGCHATDDVHREARGTKCDSCHTTSNWRTATFDHAKETGFALEGRHAHVECTDCHRGGDYKTKLPTTCSGCHRADDAHAGRFGDRCEQCHANVAWTPVPYDHEAKTHFALVGAHATVSCHTCHSAPVTVQKLPTDCASCHHAIDPHGGKLSLGCDSCHGVQAWQRDITFDHDLTRFPLLGLHAVVSCAQCHRTQAFNAAPTDCNGCHAEQDVHHGGLGQRCDSCHSPNGWAIWEFDHAKQTHFPLTGAHQKLTCGDCHRQPPGSGGKTPSDCIACHRNDDRHLGQFGIHCDRCHNTTTFKGGRSQ
jgi:hypothetical protein